MAVHEKAITAITIGIRELDDGKIVRMAVLHGADGSTTEAVVDEEGVWRTTVLTVFGPDGPEKYSVVGELMESPLEIARSLMEDPQTGEGEGADIVDITKEADGDGS